MSIALRHHWDDPPFQGGNYVQPKEKRRSRLREQRDELLAALRKLRSSCEVASVELGRLDRKRWMGKTLPGVAEASELIARIEGGKVVGLSGIVAAMKPEDHIEHNPLGRFSPIGRDGE